MFVDSRVTLANGLTLSYAERGAASGPTLVLLPGPTDSWRSYAPVLEQLPLSIRSVAVSQRGHGDSDKPPTGYGVDDFAADVMALLDGLDIERAVLAGHSGSCFVARRVALDDRERVAGLILEASPTTLRGNARLIELMETVVSTLRDPIDPEVGRSFVADTSSGKLAAALVEEVVGEVLKVPAGVWKEMFTELLAYDDLEEIARIVAPTLFIWGDNDNLVGRNMQTMLAERIPNSRLLVYAGVGHTPRWEQPSRFAADIATFVARSA